MTEVTGWPEFTDFAKGQSSAWLSDPRSVANEFQKHAYVLKHFMPSGKGFHRMLRHGANVKTKITLTAEGGLQGFAPSELIQFRQTQTADIATSYWCMRRDTLGWNEREFLLQSDGAFSESDRAQTYFQVYHEKRANWMREVANSADDELFAVPTADMETAGTNVPRSLWVIANEARTDDWASASGDAPVADGIWPGLSTVAEVAPDDFLISGNTSRWACQQFSYSQLADGSNNFRTLEGGDLLYALRTACLQSKWEAVPMAGEYSFENGDCIFLATRQGVQAVEQTQVGTHNDRWVMRNPSAGNYQPMFDGYPIIRASGMETARVYPDYGAANEADQLVDGNGLTEGGYDSAGSVQGGAIVGPRIMGINTRWLRFFAHRDKFFAKTKPKRLEETRPDTFGQLIELWSNLHPERMRAHFFIYPTADITDTTYTS